MRFLKYTYLEINTSQQNELVVFTQFATVRAFQIDSNVIAIGMFQRICHFLNLMNKLNTLFTFTAQFNNSHLTLYNYIYERWISCLKRNTNKKKKYANK